MKSVIITPASPRRKYLTFGMIILDILGLTNIDILLDNVGIDGHVGIVMSG